MDGHVSTHASSKAAPPRLLCIELGASGAVFARRGPQDQRRHPRGGGGDVAGRSFLPSPAAVRSQLYVRLGPKVRREAQRRQLGRGLLGCAALWAVKLPAACARELRRASRRVRRAARALMRARARSAKRRRPRFRVRHWCHGLPARSAPGAAGRWRCRRFSWDASGERHMSRRLAEGLRRELLQQQGAVRVEAAADTDVQIRVRAL